MNPYSPPNSGGGERKSLKLAEEIIVRAKTGAREEKRSNKGLSKKNEGRLVAGNYSSPFSFSIAFFLPGISITALLLSFSSMLELQ